MILKHLLSPNNPNLSFLTLFKRFNSSQVRVRFAPSPTGKLHIGGLRTAFYNYLFAKKHNGVFLLRVEDTDQERLVPNSVENIVESLNWAGIQPDYGPHMPKPDDIEQGAPWIQSKRLELYNRHGKELVDKKKAYVCFCDETRLEMLRRNAAKRHESLKYDGKCSHLSEDTIQKYLNEKRPYVIRFKLEDRDVSYEDLTNGIHKSNPGKIEGDFIILKSDKFPTYHFANVIDDHAMRVTHVLRGQEWQASTAKHILLYEAFGWTHPVFGHLPLIFNNDGSKVSKRQGDTDVMSYRTRGYTKETLLAYLSTIGGGVKLNILDEENRSYLEGWYCCLWMGKIRYV
jgi:glutamyl-tRNA synthetase